jgi:hypothetical protein
MSRSSAIVDLAGRFRAEGRRRPAYRCFVFRAIDDVVAKRAVERALATFKGFSYHLIEPLGTDPRHTSYLLVSDRLQRAPNAERLDHFCRLSRAALAALRPQGLTPQDRGTEAGHEAETADRWARELLAVVVGLAESGKLPGHDTRTAILPIDTRGGTSIREMPNLLDTSAAAMMVLAKWSGPRPSLARLQDVFKATQGMVMALVSPDACAWRAKEHIFKSFVKLVTALDAIRWAAGLVEGWPAKVARALTLLRESTDQQAEVWRWAFMLLPQEDRSGPIAELEIQFEDTRREYHKAAIELRDVSEGGGLPCDEIAEDGLRPGYGETMDPAQARTCWDELNVKFVAELVEACNLMQPLLDEAERNATPPASTSNSAECGDAAPPPPPAPPTAVAVRELVTLNQAAVMVHRSKRSLERYKTKGKLPPPAVEGGGGMPDLWDWKEIRPWLTATFKIDLPERFPASPRL